jgi:hypothetical protein
MYESGPIVSRDNDEEDLTECIKLRTALRLQPCDPLSCTCDEEPCKEYCELGGNKSLPNAKELKLCCDEWDFELYTPVWRELEGVV